MNFTSRNVKATNLRIKFGPLVFTWIFHKFQNIEILFLPEQNVIILILLSEEPQFFKNNKGSSHGCFEPYGRCQLGPFPDCYSCCLFRAQKTLTDLCQNYLIKTRRMEEFYSLHFVMTLHNSCIKFSNQF